MTEVKIFLRIRFLQDGSAEDAFSLHCVRAMCL